MYTAVYPPYTAVYSQYTAVYREYTAVYLPTGFEYTAVYSEEYGRILGGIRPYTHSICCPFRSILPSSLLEFQPFLPFRSSMIPGHCGASALTRWPSPRWSWWRQRLLQGKWSPVGSTWTPLLWVGGMLPVRPQPGVHHWQGHGILFPIECPCQWCTLRHSPAHYGIGECRKGGGGGCGGHFVDCCMEQELREGAGFFEHHRGEMGHFGLHYGASKFWEGACPRGALPRPPGRVGLEGGETAWGEGAEAGS